MERLVIVRHGETDYNVQRRWQGHMDIPLNDAGLTQATRVATALKNEPIDAIYTSDLLRAHATAEAINQHHNLTLQPDRRLREVSLGHFEGLTSEEIVTKFPDEHAAWTGDLEVPAPGGESDLLFSNRVQDFYETVLKDHSAETALLVSHGGTIRALLCVLLELPVKHYHQFRLDNTAISEFHWYRNRWNLVRFNDTYHLNGHF